MVYKLVSWDQRKRITGRGHPAGSDELRKKEDSCRPLIEDELGVRDFPHNWMPDPVAGIAIFTIGGAVVRTDYHKPRSTLKQSSEQLTELNVHVFQCRGM